MKTKKDGILLRLIRYAKPYKGRVACALLASVGVAGSDAFLAKMVEPFIDDLIVAGDVELAKLVPILTIALFAFKGTCRYFQTYLIRTAGQRAIQDIRNQVFDHTMRLSMRYFSLNSIGGTISRVLNDINMVQAVLSDVLVAGAREGMTLIALISLAFYTDWQLASMAFVVIPLAIWPAVEIGKKIKKFSRQGQNAMGDLTAVLEQSLSGVKVVKSFGTENAEVEKFKKVNWSFYRFLRKTFKYDAASGPIIELLTSFGVAAVLWFGLNRVFAGEMTQGQLFTVLASIVMMYTPLKRLTKVNNVIQKAVGGGERVFELLDQAPEIADAVTAIDLPRSQGNVSFADVSFAYDDEPVLQDFSVQARPGEVIALVGPSGAGKSTIIGLLNRFYDPQQGQVLIDGQDIRNVTQKSLHDNLALVDQETFLFNDSLRNNIRYGCQHADDAAVELAAQQAYADEFIRLLPEGYDTMIGDRGLRLSGGQRQRICIARAILRDAPILMLDEATSALDTESEAMVQQALGNLMRDRTTFVIAHRLSTVMHADRILVLENGRVKESGSHQQLLESGGLYKRLYDIQFQEQVYEA